MEIKIPTDPIILSIILGNISFLISFLVLTILKPNMVLNVKNSNQVKINWLKLITVSIMINIAVSLCTFLIFIQYRKVEYKSDMKNSTILDNNITY